MEIDRLAYYISQRLVSLTDINVYNGKVPDKASYPYLVFKFIASSHNIRHRKDWILELDYWEDSNNISKILTAAINVKNGRIVEDTDYIGLNNSTQCETEGFYYCNIDFEAELPPLEPKMSRYNQRFLVKVD